MPPPTLAGVDADRSVSIATSLLVVEPPAAAVMTGRTTGTLLATGDVPPSEHARAAPALVAMRGGESRGRLETFSASLRAGRRIAPRRPGDSAGPVQSSDQATSSSSSCRTPAVTSTATASGRCSASTAPRYDWSHSPTAVGSSTTAGSSDSWPVEQGAERVAVIGLGVADDSRPIAAAGLWGWHAGMQLPYIGWSTAIGSGCTVGSRGEGDPRTSAARQRRLGRRAPSWRAG